jgi:hypothetical protein
MLLDFNNSAAELDRGIMHFEDANSLPTILISTLLLLGMISLLLWWSLQSAYPAA